MGGQLLFDSGENAFAVCNFSGDFALSKTSFAE